MGYIVYGIPNCDTVKKALNWLNRNGISYEFHNYKKEGISLLRLKQWSRQVGWETLLNRKGSTWRQLDEATRDAVTNEKNALSLLAENTSAIRRPLIEKGDKVIVTGFDEEAYTRLFKK